MSRGLRSSVGTKFVVGVTGFLLAGFVVMHLLGNLQIYLGADAMNHYAATLQGMPGPLWAARAGLLAVFLLHVVGNIQLEKRNRAARRNRYVVQTPIRSTLASRTMLQSGAVLLLFVAYHLAHFTLGATNPAFSSLVDAEGRHDVYSMVVLSFQQPLVAGIYVLAMGLLGMHLIHGLASLFQTAGLRQPTYRDMIDAAGRVIALLIVLGNISIPLACLAGILDPAQGVF